MLLYPNRSEAGRRLALDLADLAGPPDLLALALPRGGVPVGYEVARALGAPLDVFVVRKLGVPGHEELAMGAVASGGARVLNPDVVGVLGIPEHVVDEVAAQELREIERRERAYRGERPLPAVAGRTVILVDDGLATGATMRAAAAALRQLDPRETVVAVPVGAAETVDALRAEVDRVVCPLVPRPFRAVGLWYHDFAQVADEDVRALLERAWSATARRESRGGGESPAGLLEG
jgi:predicted phosphoribosyltransferase